MNSPDPASLQNLNDIVLPAAVSWWPLADGWYFLFGLVLLVLAWLSYRSVKRWIGNRYRRAALHELTLLADRMGNSENRDASLRQIPILLKRTALSVYPRDQVASLSGNNWHHFLNSKVKTTCFTESTASTLDNISYTAGELSSIDSQSASAFVTACRNWLNQHQATIPLKTSREP